MASLTIRNLPDGVRDKLRVRAAGRTVPVTVVLYPGDAPGDDAWECDCPSRVDPCEHVVAAAVSLQQAQAQQSQSPQQSTTSPLSIGANITYSNNPDTNGNS